MTCLLHTSNTQQKQKPSKPKFTSCPSTQLTKTDIRKAQKALGHKRIDTTARHYVLDELEAGLTDDLY